MKVTCPQCGKNYEVAPSKIGRPAKCGCGTKFVLRVHEEVTIPMAEVIEDGIPANSNEIDGVIKRDPFSSRPENTGSAIGKIIGGIVIIAFIVVIYHLISTADLSILNNNSNKSVQEFKQKIGWNGLLLKIPKDKLFSAVGEPEQIQEIGDEIYLYYTCKDGELQIVVMKFPYEQLGSAVITEINRY